jgi:hypothetical protein
MDKAQQLPPFFLWANRHAWLEGLDLDTEFRQARDEGRDLSGVEAEFRRLLAVPKPERGVLEQFTRECSRMPQTSPAHPRR